MEKYIFDETNSLLYECQGDYLLPCLTLPAEDETPICIWGNGIDRQAQEMFFGLIRQMTKREGITEKLKAENQTEWVGRMNNIQVKVRKIVISKSFSHKHKKCGREYPCHILHIWV